MISIRPSIRFVSRSLRALSTGPSEAEQRIHGLLLKELQSTKVEVVDVSGGCGSMYNVSVESPLFAVMLSLIFLFKYRIVCW